MSLEFAVEGPFEIPLSPGGQVAHRCPKFWEKHELDPLSRKRGCYIFAFRAGAGYRPVYVGMTTRTFAKECFEHHKLTAYNEEIGKTKCGTPVMFFAYPARGRGSEESISALEYELIKHASKKNPLLSNIRRRGSWKVSYTKEMKKCLGI